MKNLQKTVVHKFLLASPFIFLLLIFNNSWLEAQALEIDDQGEVTMLENATINNGIIGEMGYGVTWAGFTHKDAGYRNYGFLHSDDGTITKMNIKSGNGGYMAFCIDNKLKMIMNANGNVGIGVATNLNDHKLNVNGSISGKSGSFKDLKVSGNVGIGRTNPKNLLDLGNSLGKKLAVSQNDAGTDFYGFGISSGTLEIHAGATSTEDPKMVVNYSGFVGIGNISPEYPLHVVGHKRTPSLATEVYFNINSTHLARIGATSRVSIFASNYIASAEGIVVHSDLRLKNIIELSDGAKDLQTLNKIEITNYKMRDQYKNNQPFKKVIAQQVQSVYPQAIIQDKGSVYIANLYQLVNSFSVSNQFVNIVLDKPIKAKDAKDIVSGASIKFYLNEKGDDRKMKTVEGVVTKVRGKQISIRVDEVLRADQYQQLFVYGTKVNDILSVDYDAISMLNVSATQELAHRVEQLEMEKVQWQMQYKNLQNQNKDLQSDLSGMNDRLEKIEAALLQQ